MRELTANARFNYELCPDGSGSEKKLGPETILKQVQHMVQDDKKGLTAKARFNYKFCPE